MCVCGKFAIKLFLRLLFSRYLQHLFFNFYHDKKIDISGKVKPYKRKNFLLCSFSSLTGLDLGGFRRGVGCVFEKKLNLQTKEFYFLERADKFLLVKAFPVRWRNNLLAFSTGFLNCAI